MKVNKRKATVNREPDNLSSYENIISENVCNTMIKMAKSRNIIVHDYARIEPEIVLGILRKDIGDFKNFARGIIGYLDTQAENSS